MKRFAAPLVLFLLATAAPTYAAQSRALVLTSDFVTGGVSAINLTTRAVSADVAVAHSDARARWAFGRLYVLNRYLADNLQVLDASTYATLQQFSLGNGANPSDIVVVSPTKAYVSLYGTSYLQIVNPDAGTLGPTINLSAFADADGLPEADRMARFGRWLFVALQRLDRNGGFVPTDTSLVAVIDTETDQVVDVNPALPGVQAIVLPVVNPVTPFAWDPVARRFHLGCVGFFGALDGGVAMIDPEQFAAVGLSATEAALGGDLGDLEWHTSTHAYAIVSDASFNTLLIAWNPTTGLKTGTVSNPGGFSLPDCALNDRGELYVCNNGFTSPGVYVYSSATDAQIAGPLNVGLPPAVVVFDGLDDDVTGVPQTAVASELSLGAPMPCPARTSVRLDFTMASPASGEVEVFDLSGRRVASIARGPFAAGTSSVRWDLTDAAGRRVAPGIYLARVRVGARSESRRVIVVP
jgi:FlgD Ig-like domain